MSAKQCRRLHACLKCAARIIICLPTCIRAQTKSNQSETRVANAAISVHGWLDFHLLDTKRRKLKWPVCGYATTRRPLALCIIIFDVWSDVVVLTVIFLERQYLFRSCRSENWDTESQKTEQTNTQGYVVCHVTATLHTLRGATCHEVTYPVKPKKEGKN